MNVVHIYVILKYWNIEIQILKILSTKPSTEVEQLPVNNVNRFRQLGDKAYGKNSKKQSIEIWMKEGLCVVGRLFICQQQIIFIHMRMALTETENKIVK